MAKTYFTASNALTKRVWEEKLFREQLKQAFFSKFMGKDQKSIIQVKEELEKAQGDQVVFGLRMRLKGKGITGSSGQTIEGNEEALQTYDLSVYLEEYAHGTRDKGPLDRQRAMFSIDTEAEQALKDWGTEKIDELCFDALTATTPTKIFYGGTASSEGTLAAGDKLTPALIAKVKVWAQTGGNRTQPPIRPVMIDGKPHYILLVHGESLYDLKQDSGFQQMMRECADRGKDNPLFTGAVANLDGVIIHDHENVSISDVAGVGADVSISRGFLLGAQSICMAWGMRPKVTPEEFDYGREHGYGISMMLKAQKAKFNSLDFGCVGVYTARTKIA